MNSEEQFDQLARRDAELRALASRGRRRSLVIMVLAFVPSPFIVMQLNHDDSLGALIPIGVTCLVALATSWTKWHRHPEDTQSVAFVGLDRRRRRATYHSLWKGSRIDDPIVLTIVESMHDHLRRTTWAMVATLVAVAGLGIALVTTGGNGLGAPWVPIVIVVLVAGVIAEYRWMMNRAGLVIDRSRLPQPS